MLDLLQNSSASIAAELARVTNVKGEGAKVFHLNGIAAVQFSHSLKLERDRRRGRRGRRGRGGREGGEGGREGGRYTYIRT